jgi:hypothetical protein
MIFFTSIVYCIRAYGVLTENGTCTDGRITIGNETRILNRTVVEYIKNLTKDNRVMAEMMCHSMLNETGTKKFLKN